MNRIGGASDFAAELALSGQIAFADSIHNWTLFQQYYAQYRQTLLAQIDAWRAAAGASPVELLEYDKATRYEHSHHVGSDQIANDALHVDYELSSSLFIM